MSNFSKTEVEEVMKRSAWLRKSCGLLQAAFERADKMKNERRRAKSRRPSRRVVRRVKGSFERGVETPETDKASSRRARAAFREWIYSGTEKKTEMNRVEPSTEEGQIIFANAAQCTYTESKVKGVLAWDEVVYDPGGMTAAEKVEDARRYLEQATTCGASASKTTFFDGDPQVLKFAGKQSVAEWAEKNLLPGEFVELRPDGTVVAPAKQPDSAAEEGKGIRVTVPVEGEEPFYLNAPAGDCETAGHCFEVTVKDPRITGKVSATHCLRCGFEKPTVLRAEQPET